VAPLFESTHEPLVVAGDNVVVGVGAGVVAGEVAVAVSIKTKTSKITIVTTIFTHARAYLIVRLYLCFECIEQSDRVSKLAANVNAPFTFLLNKKQEAVHVCECVCESTSKMQRERERERESFK